MTFAYGFSLAKAASRYDKSLKKLFEKGDQRGIPPDLVETLQNILVLFNVTLDLIPYQR